MDNKEENIKVIDYLYGEINDEERKDIGHSLGGSVDLKAEIDGLSAVRNALGELDDHEMIPPTFILGNENISAISFFESNAFRWVGSIAASLLLLLISASLLQINLVKNNQGTMIGFGDLTPLPEEEINKQKVNEWMQAAMNEYEASTDKKIEGVETKLVNQMQNQDQENLAVMSNLMNKYSRGTDQLMKNYVAQLNDENKEIIQNFFTVSSEKQKTYVKNVLADFNEFYHMQREYDLKNVEKNINLVQNNQDVKQLEQDQLLASLYDIVNTQNK
jgi:hypothetical protein